MTDLKISNMPAVASLAGSELLPVVQSGANRRATIEQIVNAVIAAMDGQNSPAFANLAYTGNISHTMGEVYFNDNAVATTVPDTVQYVKVAGATTLTPGMSMGVDGGGASNRLRYVGAVPRHFHVACSFSFVSTSNNQTIEFAIAKNGQTVNSSILRARISTGSDVQSSAMHVALSLAQNDYIEVFLRNATSTAAVTVTNLNFFTMAAS
jgi:hypothetical protein